MIRCEGKVDIPNRGWIHPQYTGTMDLVAADHVHGLARCLTPNVWVSDTPLCMTPCSMQSEPRLTAQQAPLPGYAVSNGYEGGDHPPIGGCQFDRFHCLPSMESRLKVYLMAPAQPSAPRETVIPVCIVPQSSVSDYGTAHEDSERIVHDGG